MSKAKMENRPLPKRFYQRAAFDPIKGGYSITLDGKTIRTPQQKMLQCASQQLAAAIVAEWEAQVAHIDTDTMPLTRLLNIALDRVEIDREALLADITGYAETDLLCYRAPGGVVPLPLRERLGDGALAQSAQSSHPLTQPFPARGEGLQVAPSELNAIHMPAKLSHSEELRALQVQHFDPILEWVEAHYGALFFVTQGLMPMPQPAASLEKIAAVFAAANNHQLAALSLMVPILGSALLAFAVWHEKITVEEALIACRLDETVQATHWGEDAEVAVKWAAKARDVKAAAVFLAAYRQVE